MSQSFPILSWRRIQIDGTDTPYIISDKGIIMNDTNGEFMLVTPDKDDYPVVKLFINGEETVYKVHRLCCEAFNGNPYGLPEVDHVNRSHWDVDKNNLEFVTGQENMSRLQKCREIEKNLLCNYASGESHYSNKYTPLQIVQVCMRLSKHERVSLISKKTSVDIRTVYLIKAGKIWKNISCYFSFNNDGFINDEVLDKIEKFISGGMSNKEILQLVLFPNSEYFENIIEDIRLVIKDIE